MAGKKTLSISTKDLLNSLEPSWLTQDATSYLEGLRDANYEFEFISMYDYKLLEQVNGKLNSDKYILEETVEELSGKWYTDINIKLASYATVVTFICIALITDGVKSVS